MTQGVKSKKFGAIWKTMFLTAMCFPEKTTAKDATLIKHYKSFYDSFQYTIPCKFCREFTSSVLMKEHPLSFEGRIPLMYSLYIWKDRVNKKLIAQKCDFTKPSPPFNVILKRYNGLRANCNSKKGKCI